MKKLVMVLVLGEAAYGGYRWYRARAPEKHVCARLAELCGDKSDVDRCEHDFADLKNNASPETIAKLDQCVADAKSCAEGGGCVVGTGVNVFGDLVKQFGRGMGRALDNR